MGIKNSKMTYDKIIDLEKNLLKLFIDGIEKVSDKIYYKICDLYLLDVLKKINNNFINSGFIFKWGEMVQIYEFKKKRILYLKKNIPPSYQEVNIPLSYQEVKWMALG